MVELRLLTSLRGLAAMAIVVQHFSASVQGHADGAIPSLVPHGYLAVDFFFVLSGFVLCHVYATEFNRLGFDVVRRFIARRIARIVPLHWASMAMAVTAGVFSARYLHHNPYFAAADFGRDLLANGMLLHGFGVGKAWVGPSWTISVEFVAYLMFPGLLFVVLHKNAWLPTSLLGILIPIIFLRMIGHDADPDVPKGFDPLLRCITEFTLGMFAFRLWRDRHVSWLEDDAAIILLFGGVGIAMILGIDSIAVLLFPPVVMACAGNQSYVAALLGKRPFYFLGVISYDLYMTHDLLRWPFRVVLEVLRPDRFELFPALGLVVVGSLLVVPFAWAAHLFIERPGRVWTRRLLRA